MTFTYGAFTLFGRPFQDRSARQIAVCCSLEIAPDVITLQPLLVKI